jgi:hypothetical protein
MSKDTEYGIIVLHEPQNTSASGVKSQVNNIVFE